MGLQCCAVGWGVLGVALLISGVTLLAVPNERTKARRRYNDAVTQWNAHPPPAFVPGSVVGSVSRGGNSSNLTVIFNPRGWSGFDSDDTLSQADYYLQGWLPFSVTEQYINGRRYLTPPPSGLSFTFGNRTFQRAYPFHKEVFGVRVWCEPEACDGTPESCADVATRRCTTRSLRRWCQRRYDNFTGMSECFANELCGTCVRNAFPTKMCAVVDVVGNSVSPNAEFASCHYPFTLDGGEYDLLSGGWGWGIGPFLPVLVRARNDPYLLKEQLLGRGLPKWGGNRFEHLSLIRPFVGLALAIAGVVIGTLLCVAFTCQRCLRCWRARRCRCDCHSTHGSPIEGQVVAVPVAADPKDIVMRPTPVVGTLLPEAQRTFGTTVAAALTTGEHTCPNVLVP